MNYLHFIYTKHAKQRMLERGLSIRHVEATVRIPMGVRSSFAGRQIARKRFGKKIAEIIFKQVKGRIVIITGYWVEGSKP